MRHKPWPIQTVAYWDKQWKVRGGESGEKIALGRSPIIILLNKLDVVATLTTNPPHASSNTMQNQPN